MQIIKNDASEIDFEPFHEPAAKWFSMRKNRGLSTVSSMLEGEDKLASNRIVAEITLEPLTVFYREVGVNLEALYGKPMAGKSLDQLYNDWFRGCAYEGYRTAAAARRPVYIRRGISTVVLKVGYHALYLPCGREQVTEAITYVIPLDTGIKTRDDWEKAVKGSPWF